ncbi:MAG: nucleotidyltransferase family protein [Clostridia bacterium]|nr:nucleotidyltransferase family protein [Clostridia bacterium]
MDEISRVMFALIKCGVYRTAPDDAVRAADGQTLSKVYTLCHAHGMDAAVGDAIMENGLLDGESELYKKYKKAVDVAVYQTAVLDFWHGKITDALDSEDIPYIPLKGYTLRKLYPRPYLRSSCDIDILVRPEDTDRCVELLTSKLGFSGAGKSSHDVSLTQGQVHLELHYDTVEADRLGGAHTILSDIWNYSENDKGSGYLMNDEMNYFYVISHMAKHLKGGGCGIKPFVDVMMLNSKDHDRKKREQLLKAGGLLGFERYVRALCDHWFNDAEADDTVLSLEKLVLSGNSYGTVTNNVMIRQRNEGRAKYISSRIFLPYGKLKYRYPVLEKHKILYPVMTVRRWFTLLSSKTRKHSAAELRAANTVSDEQINEVDRLFTKLGL